MPADCRHAGSVLPGVYLQLCSVEGWWCRVLLGGRLCHICIFGLGVSGWQNRSGDPGVSLDRCDQSDDLIPQILHTLLTALLSVTDEKSQEIIIR